MNTCPSCGGALEIVSGALVAVVMAPAFYIRGRVETYITLQPRTVVACTECEYAKEIR